MIYLDNGATSFPKPKEVTDAVMDYMINNGANINRGNYSKSYDAEDIVYETREMIAELFGYDKAENVVFTKNITESLNTIIFGLLKDGDHVIVSSMEHNAIMRPLTSLKDKNITFDRIKCDKEGSLVKDDILNLIKPNTKAVIMTHASNVCGTILDVESIGNVCKEKNIFFILDTAQTAGSIPINMKKMGVNAIAFTGHKSLLAPQGIGGFIVDDEINKHINTFIYGGTGSVSQFETQPDYMPDKFESGTMNIPAIYGLHTAIGYINNKGIENIHNYEMELTKLFIDELKKIDKISIIGKQDIKDRVSCVSITVKEKDLADVAYKLYKDGGIQTRCGLHCCPSGHKTLGTYPQGTVRFTIGQFNTKEEILQCVNFLKTL